MIVSVVLVVGVSSHESGDVLEQRYQMGLARQVRSVVEEKISDSLFG